MKFVCIVLSILLLPNVMCFSNTTFSHNINNNEEINTNVTHNEPYFIENNGQWDSSILYGCYAIESVVFVTKSSLEIHYITNHTKQIDLKNTNTEVFDKKDAPFFGILDCLSTSCAISKSNPSMLFLNNTNNPTVTGKKQLQCKNHFLYGNDRNNWIRDARSFETVWFNNVYPLIDLEVFLKIMFCTISFTRIVKSI